MVSLPFQQSEGFGNCVRKWNEGACGATAKQKQDSHNFTHCTALFVSHKHFRCYLQSKINTSCYILADTINPSFQLKCHGENIFQNSKIHKNDCNITTYESHHHRQEIHNLSSAIVCVCVAVLLSIDCLCMIIANFWQFLQCRMRQ